MTTSLSTRAARLWALALVVLVPALAYAGPKDVDATKEFGANPAETFANRPLVMMIALTALGLAPFVLLMVTSFVKTSVVLSIVRSALGTQQIPPTQVITGLAIILTVYIMAPVGQEMFRVADAGGVTQTDGLMSAQSVDTLIEAAKRAKEPLRNFLMKKVTTQGSGALLQPGAQAAKAGGPASTSTTPTSSS